MNSVHLATLVHCHSLVTFFDKDTLDTSIFLGFESFKVVETSINSVDNTVDD